MSSIIIYVTFPDESVAGRVAAALVNERLVACANIFPPHKSVYRWDGDIEQSREVAVLFKTQVKHFSAVEQAVKKLHPYEVPCIVSWPIEQGHGPFLSWIDTETQP